MFIRPTTLPMKSSGVMAAKAKWKYASVDCGKWKLGIRSLPLTSGMYACACSLAEPTMVPGRPTNAPRMPGQSEFRGSPNPILNSQSTQPTSTSEKPVKAMNMVFTTHLRWTRPP